MYELKVEFEFKFERLIRPAETGITLFVHRSLLGIYFPDGNRSQNHWTNNLIPGWAPLPAGQIGTSLSHFGIPNGQNILKRIYFFIDEKLKWNEEIIFLKRRWNCDKWTHIYVGTHKHTKNARIMQLMEWFLSDQNNIPHQHYWTKMNCKQKHTNTHTKGIQFQT